MNLIVVLSVAIAIIIYIVVRKETILVLHQDGYFITPSRGLGPRNVNVSLSFKTRIPGVLFVFGEREKNISLFSAIAAKVSNADGYVIVNRYSTGNVIDSIRVPVFVLDDEWHDVTFSIDGESWQLVVDKTVVELTIQEKYDISSPNLSIGGFEETKDYSLFVGSIKSVSIRDKILQSFKFIPSTRTRRIILPHGNRKVSNE